MATELSNQQQLDNYAKLYARAVTERADTSTGNPLADTVGKDFDAALAGIEQRQKRTGTTLSTEQMREQAWQVVGTQTQKQRVEQMKATLEGSEVPAVGKDDLAQGMGLYESFQSGGLTGLVMSLLGMAMGAPSAISEMLAPILDPIKKYATLGFGSFGAKESWDEREAAYDKQAELGKQNTRLGKLAETMGMSVTDLAKVVNGKAETTAPIEPPAAPAQAAAPAPASVPVSAPAVKSMAPFTDKDMDELIAATTKRFDADNNGFVSKTEMKGFYEDVRAKLATSSLAPEVKARFSEGYAEHEKIMQATPDDTNVPVGELMKSFVAMAHQISAEHGLPLPGGVAYKIQGNDFGGKELRGALTQLDTDKDGKVNHKELGILKLTDNIEINKLAEFIEKDPKLMAEVKSAVDANKDSKVEVAELSKVNASTFAPDSVPMLRAAAQKGMG
jgi:Ca2+-binding EF-hand superfamily protein